MDYMQLYIRKIKLYIWNSRNVRDIQKDFQSF